MQISVSRTKNSNFLKTLDARVKFIFTAALIVLVLSRSGPSFIIWLMVFLFELAAIYAGNKGLKVYLQRTLQIYPMFFLITLPLPFRSITTGEDILFHWYFINVFSSGTIHFFQVQIQLLLIFWAVLIFVTNTPVGQFITALERMRLPGWFIAVIRLTQHFTVLIHIEFRRLYLAFRSRYSGKKKRVLLKVGVNIASLYMMRLIARSERSYMAMISRGFDGSFPSRWKQRKNEVMK